MKKSKRRQTWNVGDCFAIPLLDETWLLGQIIAQELDAMNSVCCGLYNQIMTSTESFVAPVDSQLFAVLLVTRDLLDSGEWKIVGTCNVRIPDTGLPYEETRKSGFVGAKIIGSTTIEGFANAYCALAPWDDWYDPTYLDKLLISPDAKPSHLRYKGS